MSIGEQACTSFHVMTMHELKAAQSAAKKKISNHSIASRAEKRHWAYNESELQHNSDWVWLTWWERVVDGSALLGLLLEVPLGDSFLEYLDLSRVSSLRTRENISSLFTDYNLNP